MSNVPAAARPRTRRRRRFSLNALAIQLSAFALSFTLVALLVVSGSQAAFVEESEVLANYVPIGTAAPTTPAPRRPSPPRAPDPAPAAPPEEPPPTVEELPAEPDELPGAEVLLAGNDSGTAMFDGLVLAPGIAVERCIAVTYTGNVDPGPVRLYAAMTYGDLAPLLDLTVQVGQEGPRAFGGCAGFVPTGTVFSGTVAGLAAAHAGYDTGRAAWDPSAEEETRIFRFSVSVQDAPAAAGKTATFGFSWETRAP